MFQTYSSLMSTDSWLFKGVCKTCSPVRYSRGCDKDISEFKFHNVYRFVHIHILQTRHHQCCSFISCHVDLIENHYQKRRNRESLSEENNKFILC